jgi:hypothetical protein
MASERRALMVVWKPDKLKSTQEIRKLVAGGDPNYRGGYPKFLAMEEVEFKFWWCDQKNQQWGALYVFKSAEALNAYVSSDLFQKEAPARYGCTPIWSVLEIAAILSKKIITSPENSWLSD